MGPALDALGDAISTPVRQPKLFVGIGLTATVAAIVGFITGQIPLLGGVFNMLVLTPLVLAAILTMAYAALDGTSTFGNLTEGIERHWQPMIGAYGVLFGVNMVIGVAFTVVFFVLVFAVGFGSASAMESGASGGGGELLGALGIGMILLFVIGGLLYVLLLFVVQFIDVAIVVGGATALESFRVSWQTVTSAPLSVIGYSILRFLLTVLPIWIAFAAAVLLIGVSLEQLDGNPLATLLLPFLVVLFVIPIVSTIGSVYHVAYFDRVNERHRIVDDRDPA